MVKPSLVHGLDTSVVMRLLVGEPAEQSEAALQFLRNCAEAGETVVVSDLVVAEAYFALHAHYKIPKHAALHTLLELLESGDVMPESGAASVDALKAALKASNKIGFVDRLIHMRYKIAGASMVSFEKSAARLAESRVLKA